MDDPFECFSCDFGCCEANRCWLPNGRIRSDQISLISFVGQLFLGCTMYILPNISSLPSMCVHDFPTIDHQTTFSPDRLSQPSLMRRPLTTHPQKETDTSGDTQVNTAVALSRSWDSRSGLIQDLICSLSRAVAPDGQVYYSPMISTSNFKVQPKSGFAIRCFLICFFCLFCVSPVTWCALFCVFSHSMVKVVCCGLSCPPLRFASPPQHHHCLHPFSYSHHHPVPSVMSPRSGQPGSPLLTIR